MNRLVRLIGRRYPTYFVGIPGFLMLFAGLALGVLVTNRVLKVHAIPIGTTLASVMLCIAGAMCVLASVILSTVGRLEQEIKSRSLAPVGGSVSAAGRQTGANWVLLVFGLPGLAALVVGLLWGSWAVYSTFTRGGLLPGSYIGSASSCLAGLMLVLAGMTLHALHETLREVQGAR